MTLRLPPVQPRSRKALELAEFAREKGRFFEEANRALFKAFFEDGHDLNNREVLVSIGTMAGLDREELRAALEQGTCRERVIHAERQADALGITAVPTVMVSQADEPIEEAEVIPGAQPYEVVRAAVERAMRQE